MPLVQQAGKDGSLSSGQNTEDRFCPYDSRGSYLLRVSIRRQTKLLRGMRIIVSSWSRDMISCRDQEWKNSRGAGMAGGCWLGWYYD